jgi:RimJ/RimL family protein N-acetyltransferase
VASARPVPVALEDGTTLQVRPILPADRPTFEEALDKHFSLESHRKRFFSPGQLSPSLVSYLVDVDYVDHFAWVVLGEEDGELRGVASTRYIRLRDDPETAEIALGVTDDYQGRGVGRLLLGALGAAAPVGGVRRFRASVLAENRPMRALLDRVGAHWTFEEPGVVGTTVDVADVHDLIPEATVAALQEAAREIVTAASLALT